MAQVKINGVPYDTDLLSDEVKDHLRHMAHIDEEFARLNMQLDVLRIARVEIGNRLDRALLREQINSISLASDGSGSH